MKTTLDLPDALLIEAKQVAARRRTTLKAMVEHGLRREIGLAETAPLPPDSPYELGELGLPVLKKRDGVVTSETVYQMLEAADEEDFQHTLKVRGP